jgi:hypothetical protein
LPRFLDQYGKLTVFGIGEEGAMQRDFQAGGVVEPDVSGSWIARG